MKFLLASLLALAVTASAYNTCTSAQNKTCLTASSFCWNGKVYKCALNSDWRCVVGGDGKPGCVPTKANPRVPGAYAPYACIDNTHYAWGGILNSCATQTWCVNMAAAGQNPCTSNRPNGSCAAYGGDFGCMSASAYCQGGVRYACPPNTMCASKGPCSIRI